MPATQVLAPTTVAEEVRNVLSACLHEYNANDYAQRLVLTLANITRSQHAVWLNRPAHPCCVVAETDGINPLGRCLILEARLPLLDNDWNPCAEIHSVAAAPVRFRASVVGVLAVANGVRPYTASDLEMLEEVGSLAVAEYESLQRAEALGLPNKRDSLANVVHGLRQPLGILEACAFLLEMSLTAGETRAREQVAEMHRQLDRASGILDDCTAGYASPGSRPRPDATKPEVSDSRVLANSAMSMVT